jgi:1-acyl-sn-glycerol-3-phosphate acyltransferase
MPVADPSLNPAVAPNPTAPPIPPAPRRPVPFLWRAFTYLFVYPLLAAATVFFGTLSLICGLWDKNGSQQHFIARLWARVLLVIAFSPVTLEHGERLNGLTNPVYACNHLSYYDTPALFAKLPFQFRILAKAPLWKIPFIGWYLQRSGQVPIDQSSTRAGVASLARGVKTIQSGLPMLIFPEGGRAFNGQLQPMLAGAAYIAIKAQVPLVPLTLIGTYELLPIHVYALQPRPLKLIVGEPISTEGLTGKDAEALTDRLMQVISETYMAHHK